MPKISDSTSQFYNPVVGQYVDIDDDEFGHHSLKDVDLKRSFGPDQLQEYERSMSELQPEDLQLIKEIQSRVDGFHQQEQTRKTDDHSAKMQALQQFRGTPEKLDPQMRDRMIANSQAYTADPEPPRDDAPTTIGQGFENRPSMKPIWNQREAQDTDQTNKDYINSMFQDVKPPNNFDKLKALLGQK